ncbi:thymidylate kinase-like isoform X1 [Chenopodium quinoa]|uniref:thymidylate kinase-like isoform X1 n=1 Tax=Chenopodium quinoa TaxID=63459 RepID=UPI000B776042|nr:thymidylate kinase-like isoform X1 [Chenopodium quinoa]
MSKFTCNVIVLLFSQAPEMGLLAPDMVLYLDISPEKAAERGGYGDERYERLDFQGKVREKYKTLYDASWKVVDACLPMEEVQKMLREYVLECVAECQNGKALSHLWLH